MPRVGLSAGRNALVEACRTKARAATMQPSRALPCRLRGRPPPLICSRVLLLSWQYLVLLDDDVFFTQATKLEALLDALETQPGVQLAAGAYTQYNSSSAKAEVRVRPSKPRHAAMRARC